MTPCGNVIPETAQQADFTSFNRFASDIADMNRTLILVICFPLLTLAPPAAALELFGVALESTNRDELREAAKDAGLVLIREGGEENWFDIYDSREAFAGSRHFYLGFVKEDQRFAFAEYEFSGVDTNSLVRKLSRKYGAPRVESGRFFSDQRYRWQRDGIKIELASDWRSYRTRLSYINPPNMAALLAERAADRADDEKQVSLY